jgi:hypothetical protein
MEDFSFCCDLRQFIGKWVTITEYKVFLTVFTEEVWREMLDGYGYSE